MILGRDPMALNIMNKSGLWMTLTTLGRELKALDAMNALRLWFT